MFIFDFTRKHLGLELGIDDLLKLIGPANVQSSADPFERSREIIRFLYIGRCLFALLLGLIGGWVTVYFYHKRQRMLANNRRESKVTQ
jgi:nitrate reductase NapE component